MYKTTHYLGGIAASFLWGACFGHITPTTLITSVVTSTLPNLDRAPLLFGRIKNPLQTKEQGSFTHSLLFLIGGASLTSLVPDVALGLIQGVGSHLILDAGTERGIRLLWPRSKWFKIPRSFPERTVQILLLLLIVLSLYL